MWYVKAYFLVGEADKRPPDDKSWHGQKYDCGTTEVLHKERHEHYTDASTGVQDITDKADLDTVNVQSISKDLSCARIPTECDTESETAERD